MLKKSTVFNFLYIFQLIQKVLTSNFLNLVLNIHICLYKNSKILFLLEKNNFQVKISTFFFSQTPKSKAIFGIFVPSCPKSARNKVYQINLNFSKIQSAAMSVDVSLRSKKRITVYCHGEASTALAQLLQPLNNPSQLSLKSSKLRGFQVFFPIHYSSRLGIRNI